MSQESGDRSSFDNCHPPFEAVISTVESMYKASYFLVTMVWSAHRVGSGHGARPVLCGSIVWQRARIISAPIHLEPVACKTVLQATANRCRAAVTATELNFRSKY